MEHENPKLMKLIEKKKKEGKVMSKPHQKAQSEVLNHLMDEMDGMGADALRSAPKKVTVAATNKEDLKAGLDKAKEMLNKKLPGMEESEEESPEHEASESAEEESEEHAEEEPSSPEEIEAKIAELKAKLEAMKG